MIITQVIFESFFLVKPMSLASFISVSGLLLSSFNVLVTFVGTRASFAHLVLLLIDQLACFTERLLYHVFCYISVFFQEISHNFKLENLITNGSL